MDTTTTDTTISIKLTFDQFKTFRNSGGFFDVNTFQPKFPWINLGLILALVCSSCSRVSENNTPEHKNRYSTLIHDSIYYNLRLDEIDTMAGFDSFIREPSNQHMLKNYHRNLLKLHSEMYANFFEETILKLFFKHFYLNGIRNSIRLNQMGKELFRGTHWITIGSVNITFRENNKFDLHSMSWGSNELYEGTYRRNSDTILLNYTSEIPPFTGDSLLQIGDTIRTLNKPTSESSYLEFYIAN